MGDYQYGPVVGKNLAMARFCKPCQRVKTNLTSSYVVEGFSLQLPQLTLTAV